MTSADLARTAGRRKEGPGQSPPPPGKYTLTLQAATLIVRDPTGFAIAEELTPTATTLTAGRYRGKDSFCATKTGAATYGWHLVSGDRLILAPRSERCADREAVLAGTWRRAG
jgi:hypothetical protein